MAAAMTDHIQNNPFGGSTDGHRDDWSAVQIGESGSRSDYRRGPRNVAKCLRAGRRPGRRLGRAGLPSDPDSVAVADEHAQAAVPRRHRPRFIRGAGRDRRMEALTAACRTDGHGNQLSPFAATGQGEPLRCCLRYAELGGQITLISYAPFDHPSVWTEVGPVYVHAERCDGHTYRPATRAAGCRPARPAHVPGRRHDEL